MRVTLLRCLMCCCRLRFWHDTCSTVTNHRQMAKAASASCTRHATVACRRRPCWLHILQYVCADASSLCGAVLGLGGGQQRRKGGANEDVACCIDLRMCAEK